MRRSPRVAPLARLLPIVSQAEAYDDGDGSEIGAQGRGEAAARGNGSRRSAANGALDGVLTLKGAAHAQACGALFT